MFAQGTSSVVSALRGGIIAILCALTMLLAVVPGNGSAGGPVAALEAVFSDGAEDEPTARPDTMPGHGSGQFCGHLAPLRASNVAACPPTNRATSGTFLAPAHAWAPGPSELLTKPPRA